MGRKVQTDGKRRIVRGVSRKKDLKRSSVYLYGGRKCVHVMCEF
jgi:hypothetical protein